MELSPYIESLQNSLQAAADPAGKEVADVALLLTQALEPAARLSLLDAMANAADEITVALNDVTVEARLRGREVDFVVTEMVSPEDLPSGPGSSKDESSDGIARITLRLPESVKDAVESAARSESISVNGWLVRAIASAVSGDHETHYTFSRGRRNRSFKGFARS